MKRTSLPLCGFLGLLLAGSAVAATFTTVGVYDENVTQANVVDRNAAGPFTVTTFTPAIAAAFAAGQGGIVNFDSPNGETDNISNDGTGIVASYAAGLKSATFQTITDISEEFRFNYTTFGSLTPISGTRGAIPSVSTVSILQLNLSSITAGESIQTLAFTLLSRTLGQDVKVDWLIDGDTTSENGASTQTLNMPSGNGTDDTFFSYTAPEGSSVTGVRVRFLGTQTDHRLAIDDLAFITIPEPSFSLLVAGASLAFLGCRRR